MTIRARTDDDLDVLATIATDVQRLDGNPVRFSVARLLVAPAARRSGVAVQLLRTAAGAARARALHPVLDVVATSTGPRRLYEREGWRDIGAVHAVFSDGFSIDEAVYVAPGA